MTVQFRLCIVMISQKSPFIESDGNKKVFIYYVIYEEKTIVYSIRNRYHEENMKFVKARHFGRTQRSFL